MRRAVAGCLAAMLATFAAGCRPAPGHPADPAPRPDAVMNFSALYNENCAACHGGDGRGGPAIDLQNPEYQSLIDDASLRKWIANGMPGTEMPAFAQSAGGMLTDAQIDALVTGMRKAWRTENAFGNAAPPAYAQTQAGDAQRGQQSYQARCAGCHRANGEQITGTTYLSLIGDQALRSVIIAGRPDIGHPDWQHDAPDGKATTPLTAQEVDDIVTYLGTLRKGR